MPEYTGEQFMEFLRVHYPHLYDIEREVMQIRDTTGIGEISFTIRVNRGIVESGETLFSHKRTYHRHEDAR